MGALKGGINMQMVQWKPVQNLGAGEKHDVNYTLTLQLDDSDGASNLANKVSDISRKMCETVTQEDLKFAVIKQGKSRDSKLDVLPSTYCLWYELEMKKDYEIKIIDRSHGIIQVSFKPKGPDGAVVTDYKD